MTSANISVIIPVYNAALYIERAVRSALEQSETGEVIMVEDGSSDNSLEICRQLVKSFEKIRLFTHFHNQNKGAGASRNLGITMANFPLIAFLDADDYYLAERFSESIKILQDDPNVAGVYGPCIHSFKDDHLKILYAKKHDPGIMGLSGPVIPEELLDTLMGGQKGYFSIITLVVRRSILDQTGLFDERLIQHQDTDFIWRLAKKADLVSVSNERPLAVINIHGHNRIFNEKEARHFRQKLMVKWLSLSNKEGFSPKRRNYIIRNLLSSHWLVNMVPSKLQLPIKALLLLIYGFRFPKSVIAFLKEM
ncbi:MAG: glycosyltransferase family 2 protein [Saprospiraceae bacterium]|nr:glycosyltransferase family 2 protein [Saprospiraceae bacterium]